MNWNAGTGSGSAFASTRLSRFVLVFVIAAVPSSVTARSNFFCAVFGVASGKPASKLLSLASSLVAGFFSSLICAAVNALVNTATSSISP